MTKPFLCKLGIAQISANPAYADELVSSIQEPVFPGKSEKVGLFTIAGLEEVNALRQRISEQYINHLNRKLEAFIRFAAARGVELLVFPEYSVPPESLPTCRSLCDDLGIAIIAGTHVVTANPVALQIYKNLDLFPEKSADVAAMDRKIRQAVCVVFLPAQEPLTFAKYVRSKWESCLIPGRPALHSFKMGTKAGQIEVQVLICIEALVGTTPSKEKHYHPQLIAIPAFTPTCEDFYSFGKLNLPQGKCTLFANVAEFGGSRAFARAENANLWFTQADGTREVPEHSEALLIIEADLEKQFEVRKRTRENTAVSDVRLYPTLYPITSPQVEQYAQLIEFISNSSVDLQELSKKVEPFTSLTTKVFPKFLQHKLQHFVSHVASACAIDQREAKDWIDPLIVTDTPSTDLLRWELCSEALQTVSRLQLSGKHVERANEMMEVYAHLLAKPDALMSLIQPREKIEGAAAKHPELEARAVSVESPFIDREHAFDRIRTFINQVHDVAFVLSGMKGIGKSSLIQEAFRQVIPPTRKIWLQLTEGVAYPRLLVDLAYRCNLRIPDGPGAPTPGQLETTQKRLLLHLSQGPGTVIVLDDFEFLLNAAGEIAHPLIRQLIASLLDSSANSKSKLVLISNTAPRLGPDLGSRCSHYSLQGLEAANTRRLLLYWFHFGREDLAGQFPHPSERFVSLLAGHPLATRFAAQLWAEHPSADISKDIAIFEKLRDTMVSFILEKISLSTGEKGFLLFASIFRLPAPREVFLRWRGNEVNYVLNSLASQYLIESSEGGYQLHPLVRDFFYHKLAAKDVIAYNKIAAKFFHELISKAKVAGKPLVPEYLGEAVHHYLATGDWHAVHSLTFYKEELKPVALSHYQKKEYKLALKDYSVLVELDKNDAEAHFHLALIHARNDDWEDAELHFGEAIALKPKAPWILQGYASAKLRANKLAEAEQLLREAEEINPGHSATLVDFGRLKERQGDLAGAEEYYRRAIAADPDNSFGYHMFSRFLYRQGEIAEAYDLAMAAVATNPVDEHNKELLRELREKMGEIDR